MIYLGDESINFNSANLHDRINLNESLHDNEERVEITELNFAFGNPPLSARSLIFIDSHTPHGVSRVTVTRAENSFEIAVRQEFAAVLKLTEGSRDAYRLPDLFSVAGKMHLGRHGESARNPAGYIAANAVRYREEGPLQRGRSEAPSSQSGCAHQAAEW